MRSPKRLIPQWARDPLPAGVGLLAFVVVMVMFTAAQQQAHDDLRDINLTLLENRQINKQEIRRHREALQGGDALSPNPGSQEPAGARRPR